VLSAAINFKMNAYDEKEIRPYFPKIRKQMMILHRPLPEVYN